MKLTLKRTGHIKDAKNTAKAIKTALKKACNYQVSSIQRRIKQGIKPANSPLTRNIKKGNQTLRDTGALLASIAGRQTKNKIEIGTPLKYAAIQHRGGVIRPVRAKALAIPAGAKTRSLMRTYGKRPADCIRRLKQAGYNIHTRGKVIYAKKGKRGKDFPLFILKRQVKIPARPFMYADKEDRKTILEIIRRELWMQ